MKEITFSLPAEALGEATEALLLGDFNNWNIDEAVKLSLQEDGSLKANILLEEGKSYQFRYLLNDGRWVNSWSSDSYVHNPEYNIDNSVIFVPVSEVVIEETVVIREKKPAKKAKTAATPKAKKTTKTETSPADDLTKIEGIGPKIAKLLQGEGIVSYKDLSKTTLKKLKTTLEAAGTKFQMHDPSSWAKQAKLAAADKWEKLLELQAELKGGKAVKK